MPDAPKTIKKDQTRKFSVDPENIQSADLESQKTSYKRALTLGRSRSEQLKLHDIDSQDPSEIHKYLDFLKRHLKLYKAIFHKYGTLS